MGKSNKISRWIAQYYRYHIVKEQYPMLTFFSRRNLQRNGTIGFVYMLHHVCPKDISRIPTNEDLKVSPAFLENLILKYKRLGVVFFSLGQLKEMAFSGIKAKHPFVSFTIDDGYLDNYTYALPIFEKHEVPFSVFVATDFIDKRAILWWDSIEDLILTHDEITTNDGRRYLCKTYQQRWDTFRYLRDRVLKLDQNCLEDELRKMFDHYDVDWYEPIRQKGMTWEQVRSLASHPLCTIGGHTISHPALNKLSEEEAKREVKEGIERIERNINQPVRYFAYPYGTPNEIGEREFRIVGDFGLQLAFMAHQGCITENNIQFVTRLPRVYLKES